jgi:ethanolamine utilization protein EutN
MFLAKVIGTVWSSVKWPELECLRFLLVRPYSLGDLGGLGAGASVKPAPNHDGVVCADVLGAGIGEDVVIAYGHAARVAVAGALSEGASTPAPIDAAVVAIVDRFAVS